MFSGLFWYRTVFGDDSSMFTLAARVGGGGWGVGVEGGVVRGKCRHVYTWLAVWFCFSCFFFPRVPWRVGKK